MNFYPMGFFHCPICLFYIIVNSVIWENAWSISKLIIKNLGLAISSLEKEYFLEVRLFLKARNGKIISYLNIRQIVDFDVQRSRANYLLLWRTPLSKWWNVFSGCKYHINAKCILGNNPLKIFPKTKIFYFLFFQH